MASRNIPETGEVFNGYVPAKLQMAHITVGPATTNDLVLDNAATYQYTLLNVNTPIVITGMWTKVETAFTASVDVEIGDTASVETFFDEATIGATTAGAVLVASTGLSVPLLKAADEDILLDISGATAAAGLLHVYVQYAVLAD